MNDNNNNIMNNDNNNIDIIIDTIQAMCRQESMHAYRKYDWIETCHKKIMTMKVNLPLHENIEKNNTMLQQQSIQKQHDTQPQYDNDIHTNNRGTDDYCNNNDENDDDEDSTSPTSCRDTIVRDHNNNTKKKKRQQQHKPIQRIVSDEEIIVVKENNTIDNTNDELMMTTSSSASTSSIDVDDIDVDMTCRIKMMNWCHEVIEFCNFHNDKYHILDRTFSYLDRLMVRHSKSNINNDSKDHIKASVLLYDRTLYQLCCMTCLYITIKIHQNIAMNIQMLSKLSHGIYNIEQCITMEIIILQQLNYYVNPPTILLYIHSYIDIILHINNQQQQLTQLEDDKQKQENTILSILSKLYFENNDDDSSNNRKECMMKQFIYPQIDIALIDYSFITIKPSIIAYYIIKQLYHYLSSTLLQQHDTTTDDNNKTVILQHHHNDWIQIDNKIRNTIHYNNNQNNYKNNNMDDVDNNADNHLTLSQQKQLYNAMLLHSKNHENHELCI